MDTAARPDYQIVNALNAEWQGLAAGHRGTVACWARCHSALTACGDLGSVLAAVAGDPDRVLHALLSESAAGSLLARRAVLQAMLGKLVRMAQRDRLAGVDDYVAAMWCRIGTYPLERRPRRIAANLALDTLKEVVGERRSGAAETVTPWPPEGYLGKVTYDRSRHPVAVPGAGTADLCAGDVLTAARQLGLIDTETQAVLLSVYRDGLSSRRAAERHRTSPDMIRYRCSRAVRRLAQHAHELAEAA